LIPADSIVGYHEVEAKSAVAYGRGGRDSS
jgi:hypothetical protein